MKSVKNMAGVVFSGDHHKTLSILEVDIGSAKALVRNVVPVSCEVDVVANSR